MSKKRMRRPFELKKKYDEKALKEGKNTSGNLCAKWGLTRQEFNDVLACGLLESDGFWRGHPTYSFDAVNHFTAICKANVIIVLTSQEHDHSNSFRKLMPLIEEQSGYLSGLTLRIRRDSVSMQIQRIVRSMNAYIRKKVREKLGRDVIGLRYPLLVLIDSPTGQFRDKDPFSYHELIYRFVSEIGISVSQRECLVHNWDTVQARGIEAIAKDYRDACEKMKSLTESLNRWDNSESKKIIEDQNQEMLGHKKADNGLNFNWATSMACTDQYDTKSFMEEHGNRTDVDLRLAHWIMAHSTMGVVNPSVVAQKIFLNDDFTYKPEFADAMNPLPLATELENRGILIPRHKSETETPVTKTETVTQNDECDEWNNWDDDYRDDGDSDEKNVGLTREQQLRADTISTFDLIQKFEAPIVEPPFGHVERRFLELEIDPKSVMPYTQAEFNWNALKFEDYDSMEEYYNLNAHHWHFDATMIQWRKKALVCGLSHEEAIRRGKEMLGDDGLMLAEFCGRELEIV